MAESVLTAPWLQEFQTSSAKLQSKDHFVQGDAGTEIFDAWYKQAVQYAKGTLNGGSLAIAHCTKDALNHLLAFQYPGLLTNSRTDDFVVRSLMESIRKIIGIFIAKPKFHPIITSQDRIIVNWIVENGIPFLQGGSVKNGVPKSNKIEFLKTLKIVLDLGHFLKETAPQIFPDTPFTIDMNILLPTATNPGLDQIHRSAALDVLNAYGKLRPLEVIRSLSVYSTDGLALEPMWNNGAIKDSKCVEALIERVHKSTSSSLGSNFPQELMFSIHQAIKSRSINVPNHINELISLLRACDASKSLYKEGESERSQEMIECLHSMLSEYPDSIPLLTLALNPLTQESLTNVAGLGDKFSPDTWLKFLLPFLNKEISRMSLQGVSGNMLEQEIIDFVRECVRIFYINKDQVPPYALGSSLFSTILEAIRHGYIETERFPALAAMVCASHFEEGSLKWLEAALSPAICHTHKISRAIYEILMRLLGVYDDADALPAGSIQQQHVLKIICETATGPAFAFLTDLSKNSTAFMIEQEEMIRQALFSVQRVVEKMVSNRQVELELLGTITDFLRQLALIITPANATLLFDLTLRSMALSPLGNTTAYSDETLCMIIEKVPNGVPLSLPAVEEALRSAGPQTRYALTEFVPHLCLQDKDSTVRAQALRVLAKRPDMLPSYAEWIIKSCVKNTKIMYHDGELDLHDNELAIAGAPLLGLLAIVHPPAIHESLRLLCAASDVTAKNDSLNLPNQTVVNAISRIATESNQMKLTNYVISTEGIKLLPRLEKLSPAWKSFTQQLIDNGIIKNTIVGYSVAINSTKLTDQPHLMNENETIVNDMKRLFESGDVLGAIRICYQMQSISPNLWEREGKRFLTGTLLTAAVSLLPNPLLDSSGRPLFSEQHLVDYERYIAVMHELQTLFMLECEQILQLSARISDLNTAMIERFLSVRDIAGARKWLRSHNIHDPALFMLIDRVEIQNRTSDRDLPILHPPKHVQLEPLNVQSQTQWEGIHALQVAHGKPVPSIKQGVSGIWQPLPPIPKSNEAQIGRAHV